MLHIRRYSKFIHRGHIIVAGVVEVLLFIFVRVDLDQGIIVVVVIILLEGLLVVNGFRTVIGTAAIDDEVEDDATDEPAGYWG